MKPIVAVVGRPNVGKSTFFNRVTRSRDAIVDNLPGVTRDRHYKDAEWNGVPFTLVDTGGFITDEADAFSSHIRHQVRQAIADADAVVMMLDGKTGVSPYDREMIEMLRVEEKPVFFVVNKIDGESHEANVFDFYAFGIEPIFGISAEHGYGVPDFLDALIAVLPQSEDEPAADSIRVAVVGRPNVGKSSLINRILGQDRLVVSDVAGTTRDCVDTAYELDRKSYLLVDTAGIRRKAKVSEKLEKYSIIKALKSLDRCDVALIVLDAQDGITEQDVSIAGYAHERGCGCILLLNKWDLVGSERDNKAARKYYEELRDRTKFLNYAPVMTVSALTGFRVRKIFETVDEVYAQYSSRVGTGQVNKVLENALAENEPSLHRGRRIKFYYCSQITVKPPTFVFFSNYPEAVHFSYQRYLTNKIREGLGLDKTPIRMIFRKRVGAGSTKK